MKSTQTTDIKPRIVSKKTTPEAYKGFKSAVKDAQIGHKGSFWSKIKALFNK